MKSWLRKVGDTGVKLTAEYSVNALQLTAETNYERHSIVILDSLGGGGGGGGGRNLIRRILLLCCY